MTLKEVVLSIFVLLNSKSGLNTLHIIAFTHRNLSVNEIGCLHIEAENQKERLARVRLDLNLDELMYLTTCNRIEFAFVTQQKLDAKFIQTLLQELYPSIDSTQCDRFVENADIFNGMDAVRHQLSVASSVESMIV
ncbi:MAG: glutamyl-tRNA reductase, partial [Crocinitomicaceae bacterium]